jgi:hypothetical protein
MGSVIRVTALFSYKERWRFGQSRGVPPSTFCTLHHIESLTSPSSSLPSLHTHTQRLLQRLPFSLRVRGLIGQMLNQSCPASDRFLDDRDEPTQKGSMSVLLESDEARGRKAIVHFSSWSSFRDSVMYAGVTVFNLTFQRIQLARSSRRRRFAFETT